MRTPYAGPSAPGRRGWAPVAGVPGSQIANVLAGTVAMARVLAAHRDCLAAQVVAMQDLHALVATLTTTAENRPDLSADHFLELIRSTVMVDDTVRKCFTHENAKAFATLYFAQLTARQSALKLWYAEDAQLTVGDTPFAGATAIFEQLVRLPQAGYNVNTIDVRSDTEASTLLRVTGNLSLDGTPDARPFGTSFTLNCSSMIADQTFRCL
jgi:hypothetical protein